MKRWIAVATYWTEIGPVCVLHDIEELDELHDLIERGPDWNTLVDIKVTLQRQINPGLTVEAANHL
ncbi:MAG: hypothetical protein HQL45_15660 [Alphaproteobacteria bacterium]|nr:hypothetical protein [Alphaproteobacteria bacterium]